MPHFKSTKAREQQKEDWKSYLSTDPRLIGIIDEYAKLGYEYQPTRDEKDQLIFNKYKEKFKDTYGYYLQSVYRIKHHGKEYLVYRIIEEVIDNNGQAHMSEHQVGWHASPISTSSRNEFGEVTEATITGHRIVYEIPFDRQLLEKLIEGSRTQSSSLCVGHGSDYPPDIIYGNPWTVHNVEEFIEHDFDDLLGASMAGYSLTRYGGVNEYKQAQKNRLNSMNEAVQEHQAQLSKKVEQQQQHRRQ